MITKRKRKNGIKIIAGTISLCFVFLAFCHIYAENSISSLSNENQDDYEELKRKAETYRQIIEIKEKQGETLANQLSITDSNIQQVQSQINLSEEEISDLNTQIIRLSRQITEKESLIAFQKDLLSDIIQSYYEASKTGVMATYLSGEDIASFIIKKDRIAQTGDKIQKLVNSIAETKKTLENQSSDLDKKKGEVIAKSQELQDKNENLASIKERKQTLLAQTQGDEERYRQLLANVEAQKQQLLDIDQFFSASGLSADSYPKPDSKYFASKDWYYSQWDSRWGNENIGNTRTKMKNYGCAVTSVAMVLNYHGGSMDPGDLANQSIFSGDLINWPSSWSKPQVSLASTKSHSNVSWSTIDNQIENNNPVIVYIKRSKGGGHYVVIHHKDSKGKYVVHDPYFGANIFLDTSRALVGALGSSSSTSIDQMIIYK